MDGLKAFQWKRQTEPRQSYCWLPWLIAGIMLLALAIGAAVLVAIERHLISDAGNDLAMLAETVADTLDQTLFERYGDIRINASSLAPSLNDRSVLRQSLKLLKKTYGYYQWLAVIDRSGLVLAATDPADEGKNLSKESWFAPIKSELGAGIEEGGPMAGSIEGYRVRLSVPIFDRYGTFAGALTAQIGIDELARVIKRSVGAFRREGQQGTIEWQFLRQDGAVLADSLMPHQGQVNLLTLGVLSARLSVNGASGYVEEDDLRRHVPVITGYTRTTGYRDFPGVGWSVLVRQDRADIMAPIQASMREMALAGLAILGPLFAILFWMTVRLRNGWATAQERDERMSAVLTSIGDAVIVTDEQGRVSFLNPSAQQLTGWTQEEAAGQTVETVAAIIDQTTRQPVESPVARILRDGVIVDLANHIVLVARDGTEYHIDDGGAPIRNASGRITGVVLVLRDVTERERAEEALLSSDLRFHSIVRVATDAIVVSDAGGDIILWNDAARRIFGYQDNEIVGRSLNVLMPERFHEAHRSGFVRAVEGGQLRSDRNVLEVVGRRKDGQEFPLECSLAIWHEQDKTFIVGILRDLMERKQAERRAAGEHAVMRVLAESFSWSDASRQIPQAIAEALDWDVAALWQLDPDADVLRCIEMWHRPTIEASQFVEATRQMACPAGVCFPGCVWAAGSSTWSVDVLHDHTFLRSNAAAQIGLQSAFAFPIRTGAAVIGVLEFFNREAQLPDKPLLQTLDAIGHQIGQFIERMEAVATLAYRLQFEHLIATIPSRLLGLPSAEFREAMLQILQEIGKFLAVERCYLCALAPDRLTVETVDEWCASGVPSRRDVLLQPPAETCPWIFQQLQRLQTVDVSRVEAVERAVFHSRDIRSALIVPIAARGSLVGFLGFESMKHTRRWLIEDQALLQVVGEMAGSGIGRLRADAALRESETRFCQVQKLEAIGKLAFGVAHDFNNLLMIILACSQLMLQRLQDGDPLRSYLSEIKDAGDRGAALTRQLLAFSRKQTRAPNNLDLNKILGDMDSMLRRLIGEHIDLLTVPGSALGSVQVDLSQIEQVIMNLAVNARDAMPNGGMLTIETRNVEFDEAYAVSHVPAKSGSYVMIAASDTGHGMDAATQAHIFEPFFTTKELGKGTGLGLATVYGIVKQSDGFIWVYSEPGHGTTFKLYFPRHAGDSKGEAAESRSDATLLVGSETILLVEDDNEVRHIVADVLRGAGYTVLQADNGVNALQFTTRYVGPIDLLVTDIMMRQMNGRVLAQQMRVSRPETKVLYMSGYEDNAIVRQGVLVERTPFLAKPFSLDILLKKVREVLDLPQESGS